jgi:DNA-binding CsgD family transcriptional regulator
LGFEKDEIDSSKYHNMIHCQDIGFMYESEIAMFNFLRTKEIKERKNYKLIYDYRVMNNKNNYIRFIHQLKIFETDEMGNSWILLVLSDVFSECDDTKEPRRLIIDLRNNRICETNSDSRIGTELLSKREKEILNLIGEGMDSSDIASKLFISKSTVNNHRQKILIKTESRNIAQAIKYSKCIGIMG